MRYRYRNEYEMKLSGVKWIEKIPKSWIKNKLKRELKFTVGGTPSTANKEFFDGDNIWVTISDLNGRYCGSSKTKISQEAVKSANMKKVPKNSLLYSFKLSVGQVAFTTTDLYTNEAIAAFHPSERYRLNFWYYALGNYLIENSNENIYGAKLLNQELINNADIFIPIKDEQDKISKFLDEKTAQFDSIISKKEALIQRLEEAKKSLISEVVTGKVKVVKTSDGYELVERKKDEMKDSGVEWLGDVPIEWEISKVKFCTDINQKVLSENTPDDINIKYIDIGSVTSNGKIINIQKCKFKDAPSRARRILKKNDIIISTVRTYLKAIASIDEQYEGYICSTGFAVLSPKHNVDFVYLSYLMRSTSYVDEIVSRSKGVSYPAITASEIAELDLLLPPVDEQESIGDYIDSRIDELNLIIEKNIKQIERLKEAKQSLISEAVTGKIEILD